MAQRSYSNIVGNYRITSGYTLRRNWNFKKWKWNPHYGVDLACDVGTPVYVPHGGEVVDKGNIGPRGNFLVIKHTLPDGRVVFTEYMHLQKLPALADGTPLNIGDYVGIHTQIGLVGNTGRSRGVNGGYHLHYQEMLARDVNGDGVFTYDEALPLDPNLDYLKFSTGLPDSSTFVSGNGLDVPNQASDPGMHYYEFAGDPQAGRLYDNGVFYIRDNQTGQEFWSIPISTGGGALEVTKFANGLITTQAYTVDGQIDSSTPGTVSIDASASANVKAAFDAWVAAGGSPSSIPGANLFLDQTRGDTCLDASLASGNAVLVGEANANGTGGDMIVGGAGNDLLIGSNGNDVLWGGAGNDALAGGDGNDTYILDGAGQVTIEDKLGNNRVLLNGRELGVFTRQQDGSYLTADGQIHGNFSGSDFIVTDDQNAQVTLNQNFQEGDFGIHFVDTPVNGQYATTIKGDISPVDVDPTKSGIQAAVDANGNPIGTPQPYEDMLFGSAGNDHIMPGELLDWVFGWTGDDWIEGGTGSDYLMGGAGNDLIEGGSSTVPDQPASRDILQGNEGNDRLFGESQIDTATAIANGNNDTGTGQQGDWLSGGSGDDTLVTGAGNDVLAGGGGADLLVAGAGDDLIFGDGEYTAAYLMPDPTPRYQTGDVNWCTVSPDTFNWGYTYTNNNVSFSTPVVGGPDPADSGNDVIYAGAGADHVWAGAGDDVVYGEGGNDILVGNLGNDIILAGDGNDQVWGNDGNDTLLGGAGNDYLDGVRCVALFGRVRNEAANDAEGRMAA